MPAISHPVLDQFLIPLVIRFFFVFGIIGLAVGIGLIFNHAGMHRFFGVMNQWVSMRRSLRWLAIPRDSGAVVRRFPRLIGAAFILFAAISTFVMVWQINIDRAVVALGIEARYSLAAWMMECVRWFLLAGSLLAIAVGIMLIFFPKALHAMETRANRWYSFRSHSQSGDTMHMGFDRWVERHPRVIGWIIAVTALAVAVDFGIRLFAHG